MSRSLLIVVLSLVLMLVFPSTATSAETVTATGVPTTMSRVETVSSATFVVNSTDDAVDANIGDGICATASGFCTLRAAVQEANAHLGPDVISLPAGTYTLAIAG